MLHVLCATALARRTYTTPHTPNGIVGKVFRVLPCYPHFDYDSALQVLEGPASSKGSLLAQDLPRVPRPQGQVWGVSSSQRRPGLPLRLDVPTVDTAGEEAWAKQLKAACSLEDSSEVPVSFLCLSSNTLIDCRVSCFLRQRPTPIVRDCHTHFPFLSSSPHFPEWHTPHPS